jgi:transposase
LGAAGNVHFEGDCKTNKEVATILNCSAKTVKRQINKFRQTSSFLDKEKAGRPKKISPEIENQLVAWVESDRRNTSSKLKTLVQEQFGIDVNERNGQENLKKKTNKFSWARGNCKRSLE